ncbi:hypothetical protein GCM10007989_03620 [Devosia pacifica]|uniref:Uncharacterized protein n=1 Tax=Devosia pacifica TaxID=1335967 RepID=A0A918RUF6_9HYPH|nr:hypothetical protein [Devosia pacifica]GHA12446.1 hypothetical protein GCM10007989_03620 [Devosia pacifica]
MKLTWFGGTTLRLHIGGEVIVTDADGAEHGIERTELLGAADRELPLKAPRSLAVANLKNWRPARRGSALEDDTAPDVQLFDAGGAILIDAPGEKTLLIVTGDVEAPGRWILDAVVVLFGDGEALMRRGRGLLGTLPPKVLVLAGEAGDVEAAFADLRELLEDTALLAMEKGLALEI